MYLDTRIEEHKDECKQYRALLNGYEVAFAVAANTEDGWVDFLVPAHPKRSTSRFVIDTRLDRSYPFVVARAYGHTELVKISEEPLQYLGRYEDV